MKTRESKTGREREMAKHTLAEVSIRVSVSDETWMDTPPHLLKAWADAAEELICDQVVAQAQQAFGAVQHTIYGGGKLILLVNGEIPAPV